MVIRVPLILETTIAVIHRLNPNATKASTPYTGATSGYDPIFQEPVVYDKTTTTTQREEGRIELPPIKIPCQVEVTSFEKLTQLFQGNAPDTALTLVLSRLDLERLDLIDQLTGRPKLRVNDRISRLESSRRPGRVTRSLEPPGLFIWESQPASYGFGQDGYDLELLICADREKAIGV